MGTVWHYQLTIKRGVGENGRKMTMNDYIRKNFSSIMLGENNYWFLSGLCNHSFARRVMERAKDFRLLSAEEMRNVLDKIEKKKISPGFLRIEKGVSQRGDGLLDLENTYSFICEDCVLIKKDSFDEKSNEISRIMLYGITGKKNALDKYAEVPSTDSLYGNLIVLENDDCFAAEKECDFGMCQIMKEMDAEMDAQMGGKNLAEIEAEAEAEVEARIEAEVETEARIEAEFEAGAGAGAEVEGEFRAETEAGAEGEAEI